MQTTFIADLDQLPKVREFVLEILTEAGISAEVEQMQLMVHEAISNIMRHGRAKEPISLKVEIQSEGISFRIVDKGIGYNPKEVPPPDFSGEREGGFGCYIIGKIADKIEYVRGEEENSLILFKSFGEKYALQSPH